MPQITFGERMRKSYRVSLPENMKYKNDRPPHVETADDIKVGTEFQLGERRMTKARGNFIVMYDVIGVKNGSHPAHITVYFGNDLSEAITY
jgi:hypothetical protein